MSETVLPLKFRYKPVEGTNLYDIIRDAQKDMILEVSSLSWDQGTFTVVFVNTALSNVPGFAVPPNKKRFRIVEDTGIRKIAMDHQSDHDWVMVAATKALDKCYAIFRYHPEIGPVV